MSQECVTVDLEEMFFLFSRGPVSRSIAEISAPPPFGIWDVWRPKKGIRKLVRILGDRQLLPSFGCRLGESGKAVKMGMLTRSKKVVLSMWSASKSLQDTEIDAELRAAAPVTCDHCARGDTAGREKPLERRARSQEQTRVWAWTLVSRNQAFSRMHAIPRPSDADLDSQGSS